MDDHVADPQSISSGTIAAMRKKKKKEALTC